MSRVTAHAQQLMALSNDAVGIARLLEPAAGCGEARNPQASRAPVRAASCLGGDREAADIIASSLEREWDPDLVDALRRMSPARRHARNSNRPSAG